MIPAQQRGYLADRALNYAWPALPAAAMEVLRGKTLDHSPAPDVLTTAPASGTVLPGTGTVVSPTIPAATDTALAVMDAMPSVAFKLEANGVVSVKPANRFVRPVHGYFDILLETQEGAHVSVTTPEMAFLRHFGHGDQALQAIDALHASEAEAQDDATRTQLVDARQRLEIAVRDFFWEALEAQRLATSAKKVSLLQGAAALRDKAERLGSSPSNRQLPPTVIPSQTGTDLPDSGSRTKKNSAPAGMSSTDLISIFTPQDTTASSEYQAKPLSMAQKTQAGGADLFSFDFTNPTTQKAPATATTALFAGQMKTNPSFADFGEI